MFLCDIHGAGDGVTCCEHVYTALDALGPIIATVRFGGDGFPFLICDTCANEVDHARGGADPSLMSDEGVSEGRFTGQECIRCLEAWAETTSNQTLKDAVDSL